MSLGDLSIFVLQDIRAGAVDDADASLGRVAKAGCMPAGLDPAAARLDADQLDLLVLHEAAEDSDRIGPATHTGNDRVGQASHFHYDLFTRFCADHRLELAHDGRI